MALVPVPLSFLPPENTQKFITALVFTYCRSNPCHAPLTIACHAIATSFQAATLELKNLSIRSPRRPVSSGFQTTGVHLAEPRMAMHFNVSVVTTFVDMIGSIN